jgi:hypothetical protein
MRLHTLAFVVGIAVTGLGSRPTLEAQDSAAVRERTLRVVDSSTGRPIGGVEVSDKIGGTSALTPVTGTVALSFAKANGLVVEIRKAGYQPLRMLVNAADMTPITIALTPSRSDMSGAISRSDFHERCSQRRLACVTEEELTHRTAAHLSDFLVRTGAVRRRCETSMSECVVTMRPSSGTGECRPRFFVDGVAFRASTESTLPELERLLPPSEVLGIEVYRSEQVLPAALAPSDGCGVIAIWRR